MLKTIRDITPRYPGYDNYPRDAEGKIILPRVDYFVNGKMRKVMLIYRKNTIDFGNGLLGLLDGSKISIFDWTDLRKCFLLEEDNGERNFHWCIGGSDSGAMLGVSPYDNQRTVYETKMSDLPEEIDDDTAYRFAYGHANEELIARGFSTISNMNVVKNNTVFFREDLHLQANVDFMIQHADGEWSVLEIKTTNPNGKYMELYNNNMVPPHYYTQAVLHYPLVLSAAFTIKGTFYGIGSDNVLKNIKRIFFERDKVQEKAYLETTQEFESYLRFQTPPPLLSGEITGKRLKEKLSSQYPTATEGKKVKLSDDAVEAANRYLAISDEIKGKKREIDALSEEQTKLQCLLIDEIKDAEFTEEFTDSDGIVRYFSYTETQRTTVDSGILKTKYPETYGEVAKTTTSRRLTAKKPKKTVKKGAGK